MNKAIVSEKETRVVRLTHEQAGEAILLLLSRITTESEYAKRYELRRLIEMVMFSRHEIPANDWRTINSIIG